MEILNIPTDKLSQIKEDNSNYNSNTIIININYIGKIKGRNKSFKLINKTFNKSKGSLCEIFILN